MKNVVTTIMIMGLFFSLVSSSEALLRKDKSALRVEFVRVDPEKGQVILRDAEGNQFTMSYEGSVPLYEEGTPVVVIYRKDSGKVTSISPE